MGRVVIDVTQLVAWQGKLTGIPRVMHELSVRFAQGDHHFVAWDGGQQLFNKVPLSAITERDKHVEPVQEVSVAANKLKAFARTVLHKAESRSRLVRGVMHYPRAAIRRAKNAGRSSVAQTGGFTLQPGDTLIVLWGSWFDEAYAHMLAGQHAQGVVLVQLAYDMLPIVTPQYSGHSTEAMTRYCTIVYPVCDLILAISEYTRKDIAAWLKAKKLHVPRIETFRLGDDFAFSAPKNPTDPLFLQAGLRGQDYILCVGTIEARKNHALLYYVYKLAKKRGIQLPKIVVVGRRGWMTDDLFATITADPETKDAFVFLQNMSDEELSWLYGHCLFSIYPSHYEGWGLPVAESVGRGVPCLASNASSIPEIAGDLITYFTPTSTDECLNAMAALLDAKKLKEAKAKAASYKPTTWDETFRQVNVHIKEKSHAHN